MAKAEAILEGLQIQIRYAPNKWCHSEHDQFYGPCDELAKISDIDKKRLDELGWFIDDENECWSVFT